MKKGIRFQLCMVLCFAMLASFSAFAQSSGDVKIGKQIWMSQNLDVSTFRNGEAIFHAKNTDEWLAAVNDKKPAWCYFAFDASYGAKYGKLYNWYAVFDSRGLAPKGYHIPSIKELDILIKFLGGEDIAGKKMKSIEGSKKSDIENIGNNSCGFSALPSGYVKDKVFRNVGIEATWWTSTQEPIDNFTWCFSLQFNGTGVETDASNDKYGFAIRCIKD